MSILVKRLFSALSCGKENFKLENIKFSMGSDRNITQEMLINEASSTLSNNALGLSKKVDFIDKDMVKVNINQFAK